MNERSYKTHSCKLEQKHWTLHDITLPMICGKIEKYRRAEPKVDMMMMIMMMIIRGLWLRWLVLRKKMKKKKNNKIMNYLWVQKWFRAWDWDWDISFRSFNSRHYGTMDKTSIPSHFCYHATFQHHVKASAFLCMRTPLCVQSACLWISRTKENEKSNKILLFEYVKIHRSIFAISWDSKNKTFRIKIYIHVYSISLSRT